MKNWRSSWTVPCNVASVVLFLLVSCIVASSSQAQELAEYRVGNQDWNGLSSFALLVEHAGARVDERVELDLAELGPDDVLVIIYPLFEADAEAISTWVQDGGRLLVADDFGRSESLLARFGIARPPGLPEHGEVLRGNASLPVVRPVGTHRLSEEISTLATNHPGRFEAPGLPVFAFDDETGLLYDMNLRDGTAVFLSDPSMLTNLMLPLRDNRRLVLNAVDYLCESRAQCRFVVVAGDAELTGEAPGESGGLTREVGMARQQIEDTLRELRSIQLDRRALLLACALLVIGTLIIWSTVFTSEPPRWLFAWKPGLKRRPRSEFELSVRRHAATGQFGLPAALLRDAFEPVFYRGLGVKVPTPDHEDDKVRVQAARSYVSRYERPQSERARRRREREVATLLNSLATLPSRDALVLSMQTTIDARRLTRWYREASFIINRMELHDRFERRFARPE